MQVAQQAAQRSALEVAALAPVQQELARCQAQLRTVRMTAQDDQARVHEQMHASAAASARALQLCEGRVRTLEADLAVRPRWCRVDSLHLSLLYSMQEVENVPWKASACV